MDALRVQDAGQGGISAVLTRTGSASRFAGQTAELTQIVEYLQILAGLSRPGPPGLFGPARQFLEPLAQRGLNVSALWK
jgi:hypothetical protein